MQDLFKSALQCYSQDIATLEVALHALLEVPVVTLNGSMVGTLDGLLHHP